MTGAPGMPGPDGPMGTLPSCDDVEGDAFCVEDQDQAIEDIAVVRRRGRRYGDHGRAADRRQVDLHGELRLSVTRSATQERPAPSGPTSTSRDRRRSSWSTASRTARARCRRSPTRSTSSRSRRSPTTSPAPPASSEATRRRFRDEIDDDVRHGHVVARANGIDDALLEPVRPPGWMRGDHDLVRPERPTASSTATSGSPSPTSPLASIPTDARRASVTSSRSCAAARAGSSSDVYVLRREFSAGHTTRNRVCWRQRERADRAQELLARDGLVRDHQHSPLVGAPELRHLCDLGRGAALPQVDGDRDRRQAEEGDEPEQCVDRGRENDQRECTDRDQQETESRSLAPKRALHQATS